MSSLVLIVGNIKEILIIETAERLTGQGIKFLKASDAASAMEIMKSQLPDLVLTEIQLEGPDGFELFKQAKAQKFNKPVPFIFVSNAPKSDERMHAMFIGGKAYLEKPVDQAAVEKEIIKALQKSKTTIHRKKTVSLKGNLQSMAIPDILQMIVNYQKSGALRIKTSGVPSIYFINGEIMDASWSDQTGQATLSKIIGLPEGDFEFEEYFPDTPKAIEGDWMGLVMEGLRIRDEVNLMKTSLEPLVSMEEMIFLEEVIYWGYSSREQIVPIIQSKEPHIKTWDFLVHCGIINAEIKNFLLAELKKAASKVVASKKITKKIEQQKLSSRLKSQFQMETPDSLQKTASSKLKKSDTTQQKFTGKHDTLHMRLSHIHSASGADTAGSSGVSDNIFQRLLLALALITPDQLNQCVQEQVRLKLQNINVTIPELLVSKDLVDESTVYRVAHLQNEMNESLIPGYEIKKLIGEGGLAAVYRGVDLESEVSVAIKVFAPPMSDTSTTVVRFIRECEVIKSLEHPNIVKAYDFGEFYGLYYIVMEFLEGVPLSDKIINEGAISQEDSLAIFEKVGQGLYKAWSQGFIHRDIKPANIMVGENFVKLCDFGLAKSLDTNMQLTQAGTILGTPHYMSPEQLSNEDLDFRTDVYSLGVAFYAMLTAHLPFGGSTSMALTQSHLNAPPPLPDKFRVTVSKPTVAFLMKILSKKKEDRCGSPDEFLENIRRAKQGLFPRGGVSYFRQEKIKRIKVASLIIFFVLAAYGVYYYVTEVRARAQAVSTSGLAEVKKQEEEAKKRLEAEKQRQRLEAEKQQAIIRARERELEEKKKRELERKRAEEKGKKIERENLLRSLVETIKNALNRVSIDEAIAKFNRLEYDFPDDERVKKLKRVLANLKAVRENLENRDFQSLWPLVGELDKKKEYNPSLYNLLGTYLESVADQSKKILFIGWLKLSQKAYIKLALFSKNHLHKPWLKDAFLSLPPKAEENYLRYLNSAGSSKEKMFASQIQRLCRMLSFLKDMENKSAQIESLLKDPEEAKHLSYVFPFLSIEERKGLCRFVSTLSQKNHSITLSALLPQLSHEKKQTSELRLLLAKVFGQTTHPLCQQTLIKMLADPEPSVRLSVIRSMGKRKLYQPLSKALEDRDPSVRKSAIEILSRTQKSQITEGIFIQALKNPDGKIREKAAKVLGSWKSKKAAQALLSVLEDSDTNVAQKAAWALGEIKDPTTVSRISSALTNISSELVTKEIIRTLVRINTRKATQILIDSMVDSDSFHQDKAAQAVVSKGSAVVPQLIETFKNTRDSQKQDLLLRALEKIGAVTVSKLCYLLDESDSISSKKAIILTLGNIGDAGAVPYLIRALQIGSLKWTSRGALKKISENLPSNHRVQDAIRRALNE